MEYKESTAEAATRRLADWCRHSMSLTPSSSSVFVKSSTTFNVNNNTNNNNNVNTVSSSISFESSDHGNSSMSNAAAVVGGVMLNTIVGCSTTPTGMTMFQLKQCIADGADINQEVGEGMADSLPILHALLKSNQTEAVRLCLEQFPRPIDFTTQDEWDGKTFLHLLFSHYPSPDHSSIQTLLSKVPPQQQYSPAKRPNSHRQHASSTAAFSAVMEREERQIVDLIKVLVARLSTVEHDTIDFLLVDSNDFDFFSYAAEYQMLSTIWPLVKKVFIASHGGSGTPLIPIRHRVWQWDWEALDSDEQSFFSIEECSEFVKAKSKATGQLGVLYLISTLIASSTVRDPSPSTTLAGPSSQLPAPSNTSTPFVLAASPRGVGRLNSCHEVDEDDNDELTPRAFSPSRRAGGGVPTGGFSPSALSHNSPSSSSSSTTDVSHHHHHHHHSQHSPTNSRGGTIMKKSNNNTPQPLASLRSPPPPQSSSRMSNAYRHQHQQCSPPAAAAALAPTSHAMALPLLPLSLFQQLVTVEKADVFFAGAGLDLPLMCQFIKDGYVDYVRIALSTPHPIEFTPRLSSSKKVDCVLYTLFSLLSLPTSSRDSPLAGQQSSGHTTAASLTTSSTTTSSSSHLTSKEVFLTILSLILERLYDKNYPSRNSKDYVDWSLRKFTPPLGGSSLGGGLSGGGLGEGFDFISAVAAAGMLTPVWTLIKKWAVPYYTPHMVELGAGNTVEPIMLLGGVEDKDWEALKDVDQQSFALAF